MVALYGRKLTDTNMTSNQDKYHQMGEGGQKVPKKKKKKDKYHQL